MTRQLKALVASLVVIAVLYAPPERALAAPDPLYTIRMCESGGDYSANTGNGFFGGYQFSLETWYGVGGQGYPHLATPEEQDYRAWILLTQYGPQHWPVCSRRAQ